MTNLEMKSQKPNPWNTLGQSLRELLRGLDEAEAFTESALPSSSTIPLLKNLQRALMGLPQPFHYLTTGRVVVHQQSQEVAKHGVAQSMWFATWMDRQGEIQQKACGKRNMGKIKAVKFAELTQKDLIEGKLPPVDLREESPVSPAKTELGTVIADDSPLQGKIRGLAESICRQVQKACQPAGGNPMRLTERERSILKSAIELLADLE